MPNDDNTVNIGGKVVKPRLDFGAIAMFKKETGRNLFAMENEDFMDPEVLAALLYATAKRGEGGEDITMEDIYRMDISDMTAVSQAFGDVLQKQLPEAQPDPLPAKAKARSQK